MRTIRALGLLSGGLDSTLAARLLLDQGLDVVGLHLESPTACRTPIREVADQLGIPIETRPKGEEYLRLLRHPRYGYGRNMNPCIDCRIFMFQRAEAYLEELGADFLFTGEVLGQRPMSQTRASLDIIDRASGIGGRILRPLSALALPETEPERLGWVDRQRLLGLSGRSRVTQLRLAEEYGLSAFQSPGGGCLLTEAHFSGRLRDLFDHVDESETHIEDVALLRLGRHFRVAVDLRIVLGRNAGENLALRDFESPLRRLVEPDGFQGPAALVCGPDPGRGMEDASRLIVRYARVKGACRIRWWGEGGPVIEHVDADAMLGSPLPAAL